MDGYSAPGTEAYDAGVAPEGGNGWYSGEATAEGGATEQQGFSIPTTGQTNGGGPMRQNRGGSGSRYNPMARKPGGDTGPASAATAEKNELGYIIFAYNIGYQTDEGQLHALFQAYGSIAKVNVIQDFTTGQGKGFGFVTMPNAAEAEAAVNSLNGTDFNGNTLQVRFKSPKGSGPPSTRGSRGAFRGVRGGTGGFRGARGGPRGGGFRGVRGGGPRGGAAVRGRGRGAYSSAPSAYDTGYGNYGYDGYSAGYTDPNAAPAYGAGYDYPQADPYAYSQAPAAGTGYTSYGSGTW